MIQCFRFLCVGFSSLLLFSGFTCPLFAMEEAQVLEVIDAEHLLTTDARVIRILGVVAPDFRELAQTPVRLKLFPRAETNYAAEAAKAIMFVQALIHQSQNKILLEFDEQFTSNHHQTQSGSYFAYVYLPVDKDTLKLAFYPVWDAKGKAIFLNATIIQEGIGAVNPDISFSKKTEFNQWEQTARRQEKGVWGERKPLRTKPIVFDWLQESPSQNQGKNTSGDLQSKI